MAKKKDTAPKTHKKITIGYVVQNYQQVGGKFVCVGQEFIAGDEVGYENDKGDPIKVNVLKEEYCPFEMKQPEIACADKGLIFTCPKCGTHRLECVEDGPYSSEVTRIDEEGDFDYGQIDASGTVDRFQCLNCGYILGDKKGNDITNNEEVVEWIKKNCKQG